MVSQELSDLFQRLKVEMVAGRFDPETRVLIERYGDGPLDFRVLAVGEDGIAAYLQKQGKASEQSGESGHVNE